jgi:hypothetical protein
VTTGHNIFFFQFNMDKLVRQARALPAAVISESVGDAYHHILSPPIPSSSHQWPSGLLIYVGYPVESLRPSSAMS